MGFGIVPRLQAQFLSLPFVSSSPFIRGMAEHPAGPFTIHFWAPTAKWLISAANIADVNRPVEKMSAPQQTAVAVTGVIWARYGFDVRPVNYNLSLVNGVMACTGIYHLCVLDRGARAGGGGGGGGADGTPWLLRATRSPPLCYSPTRSLTPRAGLASSTTSTPRSPRRHR